MKKVKFIILSIWNYFKDSWEGEDHKFSYKRISQFLFVWLMTFMIIKDKIQSRWTFYAFLTIAVLFSLTAALITVPQLIKMIKYYSKSKSETFGGSFNDPINKDDNVPPGQLPV